MRAVSASRSLPSLLLLPLLLALVPFCSAAMLAAMATAAAAWRAVMLLMRRW
jgi:hypothetical protein